MGDGGAEDEDAERGEGDEEEVEVAVVALAHAVPDPGTVVVEPLDAVVADGAVRGAGRSEDLAGEAVLELDRLVLHHDLLGAGRRAVGGAAGAVRLDLDLTLRVPGLLLRRSRDYAWNKREGFIKSCDSCYLIQSGSCTFMVFAIKYELCLEYGW